MLLLAGLVESVVEDVVANKITDAIPNKKSKKSKHKSPFHVAAKSVPENGRIAVEYIEDTAIIVIPNIDEVEEVSIKFKHTNGDNTDEQLSVTDG